MSKASDRALGLKYLTMWYQLSGLIFQGKSFDDVVKIYDDRSSVFVENFGASIRIAKLPENQVRDALQSIAQNNSGKIPHYQDFFEALISELKGVRTKIRFLTDAVVETGATVAKTALGVGASYLLIIAFFAGYAIYQNMRRK